MCWCKGGYYTRIIICVICLRTPWLCSCHLLLHLFTFLLFLLHPTSHHLQCFLHLLLYPRPRPAAPLPLTSMLSALLDPNNSRDSTSLLEPKFPMVGSPQAPSYPMAAVPTLLLCGSLSSRSFQDFFPLQSQLRRTSRYWRGGFVTLVTHSGFIINTHNQSVRQENALELFLWRWCKIRNNFLSNIPSGAKSYYPRHLFKKIQTW